MIADGMYKIKIKDSKSLKYYNSLGYKCNLGDEINVKLIDIPLSNKVLVDVQCDICDKEFKIPYRIYNIRTNNSKNKLTCSRGCTKIKREETNINKYGHRNAMSSNIVKNKVFNTIKKRYGVKNAYQLPNVRNKVKQLFIDRKNKQLDGITLKEKSGKFYIIECDECENEIKVRKSLIYQRNRRDSILCPICNTNNTFNNTQNQIYNFIKNNIEKPVEYNTRSVIKDLELDIYIPGFNLALEYNGLHWHCELFKDKKYHLNKTKLCEDKNIQLIHIFSDEWKYKNEIVKSRILNLLGKSKKIYARKCNIKEISSKKSREFLNNNHLQGHVNSSIKIGLFYDDELVSLITFGKNRRALGYKSSDNEYELLRFCNKLNTTVIGGASKLFKYFINNYNPCKITSYSDRRWSIGNLYEKLGFKLESETKPNYWYIINNKREHRYRYRKSKLVKLGYDKSKSEREIMLDNAKYRIYDCGNLKFTYLPDSK